MKNEDIIVSPKFSFGQNYDENHKVVKFIDDLDSSSQNTFKAEIEVDK